jgi:hypothetical protein
VREITDKRETNMATAIENFVFRKEWRDALKGYPSEVRAEVYEAIMAYAFEGETIEMCDLARMAFNFIKLQLDSMREIYRKKCDRNRESANRRWGKRDDANGCEQMQTNANGCDGIRMDANGCETMRGDAINSTQLNSNQNNISLSLSLSGENDKVELTEEERKKIFEFFYWDKNLKYAKEETERFIAHYEANGWCRGNSDKPVKSKVALAKLWDVKLQETRWPKKVNDWLHKIYKTAKQNKHETLLYEIEHIETDNAGVTWIYCTRDVVSLIDIYIQVIQPEFGKIMYRVKKTNN